jgi:hypothetical protein
MPGKASGRGGGKPFQKGDKRAGRPKGRKNAATVAVEETCRAIVDDPAYRKNLRARAVLGELAPPVEVMLWHYGYGKPKDRVELSGPDGAPIAIAERGKMTRAEMQREIERLEKLEAEGDGPPGDPTPEAAA